VDVGDRVFRDYPNLRAQFLQAGLGSVMGLFPYDIAAAVLIAERAGCTVTDAYGNSLDSTFLLDTSEQNIRSCLGASNPVLHEKLLAEIEKGMRGITSA
jgi:myo-inositol-1(or 4)-monophosphatase